MKRKSTWILKIDGEQDKIGSFETFDECVDEALRLLAERFVNIGVIVDSVLKKRHTKGCGKLIKEFKDIRRLRSADLRTIFEDCLGEECIEEDSFSAEWGWGTIFSASFGSDLQDLHIETNIWDEDAESHFIFLRTKTDRVKYSLFNETELPQYANAFLVYQALTTTPQLRREIRSRIVQRYRRDGSGYECSGYEINLSDDTISNQIHALQKLGIPIYKRSINAKDKKNQETLISTYGDKYKDGYYLDYDRPLTPDYSSLESRSYVVLVYLTLKEIDRAHALPTQQAVVDAVRGKFGVTLQRKYAKNYLDLLIELGTGIKHDKAGYWMEK